MKADKKNAATAKMCAKKNEGISYTLETITPDDAFLMLSKSPRLSEPDAKKVKGFSAAMAGGAWVRNGNPIVLSKNGKVLDGRARLLACIHADAPFTSFIAENVNEDTLHTVDQHRPRSYAGVLEARGVEQASQVVKLMSHLIAIDNGTSGFPSTPISWVRYDRVLEANPGIMDAVPKVPAGVSGIPAGTCNILRFMTSAAGHRRIFDEFMEVLHGETEASLVHPAKYLGHQLEMLGTVMEQTGVNGSTCSNLVLALSIMALNDMIQGRDVAAAYHWVPSYGGDTSDQRRSKKKVKLNWAQLRKTAPANLGLPKLIGYPGIKEARINNARDDAAYVGKLADMLRDGAKADHGREEVSLHLVTPEMARFWLEETNTGNRQIQRHQVVKIKRDILSGNWMANAQPICFAGDPFSDNPADVRLLNGQHRLQACVEADEPIEVPIARNIHEAAFATYDLHGKSNKGIDVSFGDLRVLKAAAAFIWREMQGMPLTNNAQPTPTEQRDIIDERSQIFRAYQEARKLVEIGSAGVMTYLIERVWRENPEIGEKYVRHLRGFDLETGNPVIRTRKAALNRTGRSRKDQLSILLDGWENYKQYATA